MILRKNVKTSLSDANSWDINNLRFPCIFNISKASDECILDIVKTLKSLESVRFNNKPLMSIGSELVDQIKEYKKEVFESYRSKDVYFLIKFDSDKYLNLSLTYYIPNIGITIYKPSMFKKLIDAVEMKKPLLFNN